ncbi:LAQU0S01e06678g1_1 [Lachancea quebecensis]|uniref:LAQU0S01e06678g1_1 n=1 Tax=Lachancea quebecensis TaxID=1654605 RepID=A0A0P1KL76_9SACH|nr:LAQU0S01e06678g1_1 [Lachancea quebecensis]
MAKNKKKASKPKHEKKEPVEADCVASEPELADSQHEPASEKGLESIADDKTAEDEASLRKEVQHLQNELANLKLQLEKQAETESEDHEDEKSGKDDKNAEEKEELTMQLAKVQEERDQFENQYNSLLSRLSSMKSVFNKMRESQEELDSCQEQLREYESQNLSLRNKLENSNREHEDLQNTVATLNQEVSGLNDECELLSQELSEAVKKSSKFEEDLKIMLSQTADERRTWESKFKELELLLSNRKQDMESLKEEREDLKQRLEKSERLKEASEASLTELERQLELQQQTGEEIVSEKVKQIQTLEAQVQEYRIKNEKNELELANLLSQAEGMKGVMEQKEALQQECKERLLQIGKLRHEAIILNEHLTKALAMLKKSSDSETVDKELISNLLISFVAIPRADPKKFEVLELISSFLNWDDDKKQQAGLIYAANGQRPNTNGSRTQNFVSLWTEFLEKESVN